MAPCSTNEAAGDDRGDAATRRSRPSFDKRQPRFAELGESTLVLGSEPVTRHQQRLNEAFAWTQAAGYRPAHAKYYLPDDDGFWEASWYQRGDGVFAPIQSGALRVGFLLCTELWFMHHARAYGKAGVHIIASPRATGKLTLDKWLAGGRASAVVAGVLLSSRTKTWISQLSILKVLSWAWVKSNFSPAEPGAPVAYSMPSMNERKMCAP